MVDLYLVVRCDFAATTSASSYDVMHLGFPFTFGRTGIAHRPSSLNITRGTWLEKCVSHHQVTERRLSIRIDHSKMLPWVSVRPMRLSRQRQVAWRQICWISHVRVRGNTTRELFPVLRCPMSRLQPIRPRRARALHACRGTADLSVSP